MLKILNGGFPSFPLTTQLFKETRTFLASSQDYDSGTHVLFSGIVPSGYTYFIDSHVQVDNSRDTTANGTINVQLLSGGSVFAESVHTIHPDNPNIAYNTIRLNAVGFTTVTTTFVVQIIIPTNNDFRVLGSPTEEITFLRGFGYPISRP